MVLLKLPYIYRWKIVYFQTPRYCIIYSWLCIYIYDITMINGHFRYLSSEVPTKVTRSMQGLWDYHPKIWLETWYSTSILSSTWHGHWRYRCIPMEKFGDFPRGIPTGAGRGSGTSRRKGGHHHLWMDGLLGPKNVVLKILILFENSLAKPTSLHGWAWATEFL